MTVVIAHRGASGSERENTIEAFRRAVQMGAEGIELDVRRTADDVLVVHHDATLNDGTPICKMRSSDLPDHVPTLGAALDACLGAFVNVEIKNSPNDADFDPSEWVAHRVTVELERRRQNPRWLVSSFRRQTVDTVHRISPTIRTAWLTYRIDTEAIFKTVSAGHLAIHPAVDAVDAESINAAHAAGLMVNTWTCDDPDQIRQLIAWGIDGICTNVPDVALAIRSELAHRTEGV